MINVLTKMCSPHVTETQLRRSTKTEAYSFFTRKCRLILFCLSKALGFKILLSYCMASFTISQTEDHHSCQWACRKEKREMRRNQWFTLRQNKEVKHITFSPISLKQNNEYAWPNFESAKITASNKIVQKEQLSFSGKRFDKEPEVEGNWLSRME